MHKTDMNTDLLIAGQFPPYRGGVSHYLSGLFREYAKSRKLSVITLTPSSEAETGHFNSIERISGKLRKVDIILVLFRVLKHVMKNRTCNVFAGSVLPEGLIALFIKMLFPSVRIIIMTYGSEILRNDRKGYPYLRKLILAKADIVCTISNYTACLLSRFHIRKLVLAPPGYEGSFSGHKHQGVFSILTVSALIERKGHMHVIRALDKIRGRMDFRYVIAGSGPMKDAIENEIKKRHMENMVSVRTGLSNEEIEDLYRNSDLFVMPSFRKGYDIEGFGIVYLEAGAHGLPVIAANSGGVPDVVQHGVNGMLVREGDIDLLADAVFTLYKDSSMRERMGNEGIQTAKRFTYSDSVAVLSEELT